jgi:hypothetical protein
MFNFFDFFLMVGSFCRKSTDKKKTWKNKVKKNINKIKDYKDNTVSKTGKTTNFLLYYDY